MTITRDIAPWKRAEALLESQKVALEQIIEGQELPAILETLTTALEANAVRPAIATIMLVSEDGTALIPVAGRSAPPQWTKYIEKVPIAPGIGSCGSAAYEGNSVVVCDIASDPRWSPYKEIALSQGLKACWSTPIVSSEDAVVGTFAIYYPAPTTPTREEISMVEMLTRTAAVAIQKSSLNKALEREQRSQRVAEVASRRLAAIVESSDDAIIAKDLNGIVQSWNNGAERIFGYTTPEIVGRSITILLPENRLQEEQTILSRLRAGERIDHFETIRRRKNGELIEISLTVSPIRDSDGKIIGASKIARDITDRKRAEAQQKALYELVTAANRARRLEDIYGAALEALARCQRADRIAILVNNDGVCSLAAATETLQGLGSASQQLAAVDPRCFASEETVPDLLQCVDDPGLVQFLGKLGIASMALVKIDFEGRNLGFFAIGYRHPHEFRPHEFRSAATVASQVAFAIERKRAGEALEQLVNERTASLRKAIEQMEEFSYTVSHDLRAPLRGMHAYSSALTEDFAENLPPEARRFAEKITENSKRLDRMILDLLTFSRLAGAELKLEPISLNKLVREIIEQYPSMQSSSADITVGNLQPIIAHEASLVQAISNLLGNAVKFVPADRKPCVQLYTEPRGDEVRLWIKDNGIGIEPKYQHRLFNMFERIHPTSGYEGTGVGLAIVRKAVERMGGTCGVESDGANGSSFWIQLRAAHEQP